MSVPARTGPLVAILLRTCDRPILLARALAGILAQTHQNWLLLLVNAGDPRPVEALIDIHASGLGDRLTLLHVDAAGGPDRAAMLALEQEPADRADCVAVHDDDDAWHPDFLRSGLDWLAAPVAAGFVAVACHGWRVEERIADGGIEETARAPGFTSAHPLELSRLLDGGRVPSICLLIRRAAMQGLAAAGAGASFDAAGLATALLFAGDVGVIPRRLAFVYRRTTRAGPYANRSPAQDEPAEHDTLRRNAMLRTLAEAMPAMPGLLPAMGVAVGQALRDAVQPVNDRLDRNGGWGHGRHADLQERLIRIEAAIEALRAESERAAARRTAAPGATDRPLRAEGWLTRLAARRRPGT